MAQIVVRETVYQEPVTPPIPWTREEQEVEMLASPEWYEHRHRIVEAERAERRARIAEKVKNIVCGIALLVLIFGSCVLFGGY